MGLKSLPYSRIVKRKHLNLLTITKSVGIHPNYVEFNHCFSFENPLILVVLFVQNKCKSIKK